MYRHASMNRIYRLVWNQVRSAWVPVAETAKSRGQSRGSRSIANRNLVAAAITLALSPPAFAAPPATPCVPPICGNAAVSATSHPTGGQIVSGSARITQSGNTTDIRQSSPDVSIDWLSFNVGAQETVNFIQPSASAIAVNRIAGTNGSAILGHLDANGQVYLINPNGVVFGQGSQVNVGGLVASTLDVSDSGSSDSQSFAGNGTGSIVNRGTITAANGGYVALIGNRVSNQGVITAQLGTVALGAGGAVSLEFSGNRLVHLHVDQSTLDNLAANNQLIEADGGLVIMTAGAQRALLASVVNNTGVIEARTVANHNGTIELLGGMTAGAVNVFGTLDASAPDGGNGGFIETSAAHVEVANNTKVTTEARDGLYGTWLVDPTDFTVAPSGGDITGTTLSSDLNSTNFTILSSTGASPVTGGGSGGNINVNDTVSWGANTTLTMTAANNVNVNGTITASGATAGLAINPNTANGSEMASGAGIFNLGAGASVTLSGANASLSVATPTYNLGAGATINLPNVSPSSSTALVIGGTSYTVLNSLGAPGSTTGTDLQGINGNLSGYYALGSNIDATGTLTWNGGAGFTPIGNGNTTFFTGTFDGLGHTISNLSINLPNINNIGLFGESGPASVILNVGLLGTSVSGSYPVGGLVGANYGMVRNSYVTGSVSGSEEVGGLTGVNGGTISNSYATGNVRGTYYAGGLVGLNAESAGTISNSYATGTVNGYEYVGGLVGLNQETTISNSFATGNVSGTGNDVGGLVGANYGVISNSYATGNVTGAGSSFGGMVGYNNNNGTINNSYATGTVSDTSNYVGGLIGQNAGFISTSYATGSVEGGSYVGGLVGTNLSGTISTNYSTGGVSGSSRVGGLVGYDSGGTVSNSYWNTTTSGQPASAGGTGLTTAQMQTAANFAGFTFTTTPGASGNNWVIVDTDGTLNNANLVAGATYPMLASEYSTVINNAHQLQLMAMNTAASYTLGQNINAAATGNGTDVWGSAGFVPIGNSTTPFAGTLNGLGHTIDNLTINLPSANNVGLIGYSTSAAVVENVGLIGGSVTGGGYDVGSFVGRNDGSVSNSYATVDVSGSDSVGGLVGYNDGGGIFNSYSSGNVSGSANVGGLVGFNERTISNSYATGGVSGNFDVGGLAGVNLGTINYSHATGNVSGTTSVGGLVGEDPEIITNSFATGTVNGSSYVGGLVGHAGGGLIGNSFATGSVTGVGSVGGLLGYSDGTETSNSYATGAVSGSSSVGGLLGSSVYYSGVENSYAIGSVTGTSSVGGLVGSNASSFISNSYAAGSVSSSGVAGGLVGNNTGVTASNSFWNISTSGQATSAGGIGMTTANMQQQVNFTSATSANGNVNPNWDFLGTWVMYNGYTYPLLRSFMTPLTVTANSGSMTYNGSAYSGAFGVTYSAPPNGNLLGTLTYTSTPAAINVGAYSITPGGLYSNQQGYIISFESGGLTINPATLTVTGLTGTNRVYNGSVVDALSGTGVLNGLVGGQTLTLGNDTSGTLASANAGSEPISTALTIANGTGLASNYTLTQPTLTNVTIAQAPLTVTGLSGTNRVYNGSVVDALSGTGVLNGLVGSETLTLGNDTTGTLASANAGGEPISTALTIANGTGLASNYTLIQPTLSNVTIAQAPLTVTGLSGTNRVYNGSVVDALSGTGVLNGLVGSQTLTLGNDTSGTLASANAGGEPISTALTIGNGTGLASNYTLIQPTLSNVTIAQAPLTVTGLSGTNRVYNGSVVDTLSGTGVLNGLVGSQTLTLGNDTSGTLASANAGGEPISTALTIGNGTGLASNYTLIQPILSSVTIAQAPLTVTGLSGTNRVYNGSVVDALSGTGVLNGLIGSQTLTLGNAASGTLASANAGSEPISTALTIGNGTGLASNYTLIQPIWATSRLLSSRASPG
jgi:filamentous hemagglutinin family protein